MYHRVPRSSGRAPSLAARGRRWGTGALVIAAASVLLTAAAHGTPTPGTAPSISGGVTEPATLTETQGTWTPSSGTVTLAEQWYICSSSAASSCTSAISGATGTTYTTSSADVGQYVAVIETASDGTAPAATATSNLIGPIADPPAPTLVTAPEVSGTVASGDVLTATAGTWNNSPTSYTYQWYACSGAPLACAVATGTGATTASYTVGATEAGDAFEVDVTAVNDGGPSAPAASAPALPAAPANTAVPQITGTVAVGQTLTASTGTWTGSPYAYTYQWERCSPTCGAISGATAASYTLAAADAGTTTEVQVTATNAGGSATATSAGSALTAPPALIAAPAITGTPEVGQTLTETAAHWSNSPTSTTVQWWLCDSTYTNCTAIAGATAATYTAVASDAGGVLQVSETATNAGGSTTAVSPFAGPVTIGVVDPSPVNTSLPTVSGTPQQGSVLTATSGGWAYNPGTFIYQWLRCGQSCTPIPGADSSSYALAAGDVGSSIAVQVTAANGGGSSAPIQSARSARVTTPTNTALLAGPSALVTDQVVTLTAIVTTGTGIVSPSGSLSFTDNGTAIQGCTGLGVYSGGQTGTVSCQTSFVASVARVAAAYSPSSGSLATGSSSPVATFIVGRAKPRITVSGSSDPGVRRRTTFTIKIDPPSDSTTEVTPSGYVRVMTGSRTIAHCGHLHLRRQTASCTVSRRSLDGHRLVVAYGGDGNFQPTKSAKVVTVAPQQPAGFVTALMSWTFDYTPSHTTIPLLGVTSLSPGMTISLACRGGGCPFASHHVQIGAHGSCSAGVGGCSVDLVPLLHRARLRPGATLVITITHPRWIGKYYQFVILSGHAPRVSQNCLAAGGTQPGIGCTGA